MGKAMHLIIVALTLASKSLLELLKYLVVGPEEFIGHPLNAKSFLMLTAYDFNLLLLRGEGNALKYLQVRVVNIGRFQGQDS